MLNTEGVYRITRWEGGRWQEVVRLGEISHPESLVLSDVGLNLDCEAIDQTTGDGGTFAYRLEKPVSPDPEVWEWVRDFPPLVVRLPSHGDTPRASRKKILQVFGGAAGASGSEILHRIDG